MTTLTVSSRRQITLRKEVLMHLGITPGDKIQLDLLPNGRAQLSASGGACGFRRLQGLLKAKTNGAKLTIDEIGIAIGEAGAAAGSGET